MPALAKSQQPVKLSCLCKNSLVTGSVVLIKLVEDRKYDAIHTVNIDKTHHRTCKSTYFHNASLDAIRGGQLSPGQGRVIKGQEI